MADPSDTAVDHHLELTAIERADVTAQVRESGVEHIYYQFVTLSGRVMAKVVPAGIWRGTSRRACSSTGRRSPTSRSGRHGNLIASGADAEEFLALPDSVDVRGAAVGTERRAVLLQPLPPARLLPPTRARRSPTCVRTTLRATRTSGSVERTGLELRSGCEPEMSWFGDGIEPHVLPNVFAGLPHRCARDDAADRRSA